MISLLTQKVKNIWFKNEKLAYGAKNQSTLGTIFSIAMTLEQMTTYKKNLLKICMNLNKNVIK